MRRGEREGRTLADEGRDGVHALDDGARVGALLDVGEGKRVVLGDVDEVHRVEVALQLKRVSGRSAR